MNSDSQFIIGDQSSKQQECAINNHQAKQIATVKWLLQKAYDNNVPEHLKEPFYYDKRQQQQNMVAGKNCTIHLKPNIVYSLANAELYCLALANIYLDPNFHNLNHTGIIQALARKGVMLSDPQLTETVLLQTSPLKLTAHLCVIEAIMILYAKELATPDRIYAAIKNFSISSHQRFHNDVNSNSVIQQWNISDYDQLLLLWISEGVSALNKRIKQQIQSEMNDTNSSGCEKNTNEFFKPPGRELTELCDGVALCALVSFYCPQSLPWKKIRVGKPTNTAECIHNLNLFCNFCQFCLPYQIFHMLPQDILPQSISGMRPNLLALLADLFNLFEIHPVSTSTTFSDNLELQTSSDKEQAFARKSGHNALQKRSLTANQQIYAIPNLRNYSNIQNGGFHADSRTANSSPKLDRKSRNNSVSDPQNNGELFVVHKGRNIPTLSSVNSETSQKEKQQDAVAAGKPSNWKDTRKNQLTGCGRRSRRNSFSDDSQLTIENFGGSHENINLLGRNPDKEPAVHVVNPASDDASDSNEGKQYKCQVAAQENWSSAAITSLLRDNSISKSSPSKTFNNIVNESSNVPASSVPVLTTTVPSVETAEMLESCKVSSQMLNIRLKLEEKRRQIEMEKRRMELNLKKQRQKLNKAAFLQAVSKIENEQRNNENCVDSVNIYNSYGGGGDGDGEGDDESISNDIDDADNDSIVTHEDISQVEQRWLKNDAIKDIHNEISPKHEVQNTDFENIDIEKCQKSISEMDSSLHAIQTDLQWLSLKENEMFQNPVPSIHNVDLSKSYSASFSLNQENKLQNQLLLKNAMVTNHSNQNNDYGFNQADFNGGDGRGTFIAVSNKKMLDSGFPESCSTCTQHNQHHHSLTTDPMKPHFSSPHSPMMTVFDNANNANDNCYTYQMQQQPVHLHSHMSPNFQYNYHSMLSDSDGRNFKPQSSSISDDKENQVHMHQARSEQFYLHKPCENSPFHIHSSTSPTVNLSSITNTPFGQRKTWENRETMSHISPQPTPPPRTFTSRYPPNKDSVSLSKSFIENKLKAIVGVTKFADKQNSSPSNNENITSLKRNYTPTYDDRNELNYNNYYNISEVDSAPCNSSAGSLSISTPSVDDMEPQCISFIGSQSDDFKVNTNEPKNQISENVNKLNIINGNRTYRIPSPTNKPHNRPSGNYPFMNDENKSEKGFYVSFSHDDSEDGKDNMVRFSEKNAMKAPLRMRRFNSGSSISSLRNDKMNNGSVKKTELTKKPDTIYNEKSESNENQLAHRLQENSDSSPNNKVIEKHSDDTIIIKSRKSGSVPNSSVGLLINSDVNSNDPALVDEMERKKERILMSSLQRRQQQEEMKARKEIELQRRKEQEKQKEEMKSKKKEEEKRRRAMILEQHRLKKTIEELEREGKPIDKELLNALMANNISKSNTLNGENTSAKTPMPKLRSKKLQYGNRPRPKTIHIDVGSNLKENNSSSNLLTSNFSKKGSSVNLAEHNNNTYGMGRRDYYRGSQDCLLAGTEVAHTAGTSASSIYSDLTDDDRAVSSTYPVSGSSCGSIGRRRGSSYKTSRDVSLDRATSRIARPKFSTYYQSYPRKSSSLMNLYGSSCDQDSFTYNSRYMADTDSVLGRATPPHRTSSPAPNNSSPSGPGSLPPSHHSRRLRFDDTASESGGSEYSGLRLYKQPAVKSNRGIIVNAIEYVVFPGEVNRNAKNRILEEISKSEVNGTKHFLILFRDARCQFRALYSYYPENEEIIKACGTGPKQVTEKMFDKFFKYNSGGKCFAQVHTKHLTVTIDAFTIHNSLWQGKKVNLPNKRDMTLVI